MQLLETDCRHRRAGAPPLLRDFPKRPPRGWQQKTELKGTDMTAAIPTYERAVWANGHVINKGALPLWSGKGEPPAIGSEVTCDDRHGTRCKITGYKVEHGWLMATGVRLSDGFEGDLAGAEIRYPVEG